MKIALIISLFKNVPRLLNILALVMFRDALRPVTSQSQRKGYNTLNLHPRLEHPMTKFRILIHLFALILISLSACQTENSNTPLPVSPPTSQALVPATPLLQPTATPSTLERYYIPAYYSTFYGDIIIASQKEEVLTLYSAISEQKLHSLLSVFKEHYPWITVSVVESDDSGVFQRYTEDLAIGQKTADLLISADTGAWQKIIGEGQLITYQSQEGVYLPTWARSAIGIYALASDPLLIVYNKTQVRERISSMSQIAALNPTTYRGRILTLDAEANAVGFVSNWFYATFSGNAAWTMLRQIGATFPVLYTSSDELLLAVGEGQAAVGYFLPASDVFPHLQEHPNLDWSYIKDGQPILVENMAITQGGESANSAKLLVDFVLSQEGQMALAQGGLTPYRPDVYDVTTLHIDRVGQEVGAENIIYFYLDPAIVQPVVREAFLARWNQAIGKIIPEATVTP